MKRAIDIPSRYVKAELPSPIPFCYIRNQLPITISSVTQQEWLEAFISNPLRLFHPYLVSLSAYPTDDKALAAAFAILKAADSYQLQTAVVDIGNCSTYPTGQVVMIHGINQECTRDRSQLVKDAINKYHKCLRLVVSAGQQDPISFAESTLRVLPDVAFQFTGHLTQTLIL